MCAALLLLATSDGACAWMGRGTGKAGEQFRQLPRLLPPMPGADASGYFGRGFFGVAFTRFGTVFVVSIWA